MNNASASEGVLLVLSGAFGPAGGLEMYDRLLVMETARICAEQGRRCDVIVLNDKAQDLDQRYLENVTSVFAASRSKARFTGSFLRLLVTRSPRIIIFGHVNLASLSIVGRILRPRACHWFFVYGIDFWHRLPFIGRLAVRRAEKLVSISDYTRSAGAHANGLSTEAIELLPCALDPFWEREHDAAARNCVMPTSPVLLTVARLAASERYKGLEEVLRSMPALLSRHPDLTYTIVGDGDDRDRLQSISQELGIASAVHFTGRVPSTLLAKAYSECTAFIMPSQKEGFGIVFLEAALFGKPSIGAVFGGIPEVIEDGSTGILLSPSDPAGLVDGILSVIGNRDHAAAMGAAARARLRQRFTYPAFARRLRELLGSV